MVGILIFLSITTLFVILVYLYADRVGDAVTKFIKYLGGKDNE